MANSIVYTGSSVISTYDTSGTYTWTKDDRALTVTVIGWGGGGGGGSGRQGSTTAAGGGNGGGNGGCFFYNQLPTSFFDATETVVVGAGGTGGAAQASASTNGTNGTDGTNSSIGSISTTIGVAQFGDSLGGIRVTGAYTGSVHNYGGGGKNGDSADGGSFRMFTNAPMNLTTTATSAIGLTAEGGWGTNTAGWTPMNPWYGVYYDGGMNNNALTATAGGGGGGADSSTERTGGVGGNIYDILSNLILAGGTAGLESGTINGGNGNGQVTTGGLMTGGTGGGGGGGQSSGAAAGDGGDGGFPGGGGGGGGGSINGTSSGAGGDGGDGMVIIIEQF